MSEFRFKDFLIIVVFLFISIFCVYLFWHDLMRTFSLQNVTPVGTVVVKRNTVQRRHADRVLWGRLARESPVYVGDLVRIAETSAATLILGDTNLFLEENTLFRIMLAPDGVSLIIDISSGGVSVVTTDASQKIFLQVEGKQVEAQPGTVLSAAVTEEGSSVRESEVTQWLSNSGRTALIRDAQIRLVSPAPNSRFRYLNEKPAINFVWNEIEEASSYVLEISNSPNFDFIVAQRQIATPFYSGSELGSEVWYWRVKSVYPGSLETSAYSSVWFLWIEEESVQTQTEEQSLSKWLATEAPSATPLPPNLPPELIPAHFAVSQPRPAPQPAPARPVPRTTPQPTPRPPAPSPAPSLFAAPQIIQPVRGSTVNHEQLNTGRSITFSWTSVQGANAYIFSFYQQYESERRLIVKTEPVNRTNYTFTELPLLDRGNFLWQVEAVSVDRNNVVLRRGTVGESMFVIDFHSPRPVIIDSVGNLYGN